LRVIHFTAGATDSLLASNARGAQFVPLADGVGDAHIGCLRLAAGGRVPSLPMSQACVLLIVQGELVFEWGTTMRLELSAGVGVVLNAGEQCALVSRDGAILILVQSNDLEAHDCGISTPQRIMGQRWPGEAIPGGTVES
jgi:hypothetical protein